MLLSFRVANHGSLREPQELNLVPAYEDDRPAVPVVAIYGANASGKSTLMDAFRFFKEAVRESQARWLPGAPVPGRRPFLLDHTSRAQPSTYAVDVLVDGVRYVYGFAVTDQEITEEWLYSYPKARRRVLFERAGMSMSYGARLGGGRAAAERILRPNSLYLSAAAQSSHPELGRVWSSLTTSLIVGDGARQALLNAQLGAMLSAMYTELAADGLPIGSEVLAAADLGVHEMRPGQERPGGALPDALAGGWSEKSRAAAERSLEFVHVVAGEEFILPAEAESAGTKTWLNLVSAGLLAVLQGEPMWVDEIDVSLHPMLTAKLISLFQNTELNPRGAQLIFTTHDASLLGTMLGEQLFRRDQVWFVEKDAATGAAELYPLSDFKPRKGENFERRYLAGSYGAVPLLPETAFEDMLKKYWGARDGEEVPA